MMVGQPYSGELNVRLDERREDTGNRRLPPTLHCNIYARTERAGKRVMASIVDFIEKRLRLKVNAAKSAVGRVGTRHFLGFTLVRKKHVAVVLSKRSRQRIAGRIRELTPRTWGGKMKTCIERLNRYLKGWINFFAPTCSKDVIHTLETLDSHIRRRLRAMQLKQWKRKRTIARRLVDLGVSKPSAWGTVYRGRRSLWTLSHMPAVEMGLGVDHFTERGLVSLELCFRDIKAKTMKPIVPKKRKL